MAFILNSLNFLKSLLPHHQENNFLQENPQST